mmetsp:Transcript_20093/g.60682  ORF Transcript_20093/g.60682 Transcript_20093/m.60682 type:complete len:139 (-) Transcript_20093:364-780(-)|eukprot:CAMPEP_0206141816 /NCGR_PEP_ID=MMETSP1473-20131121/14273_1 /ASSEMBLY_ACC=CAM_ASM_001109 /TAXON_ID=1461547 /ORGANISM="Stichococcus sp, Strain RCC1054" /LENGTH=138 /DNA_ID=CAMNT_0053536535 /DNA_START=117 /DNA_END=533 /DNA_ORIENTATION=+
MARLATLLCFSILGLACARVCHADSSAIATASDSTGVGARTLLAEASTAATKKYYLCQIFYNKGDAAAGFPMQYDLIKDEKFSLKDCKAFGNKDITVNCLCKKSESNCKAFGKAVALKKDNKKGSKPIATSAKRYAGC